MRDGVLLGILQETFELPVGPSEWIVFVDLAGCCAARNNVLG